ncbi:hypothetical protein ACU686_25495 [Yinghuangia aomiensis]
MLDSVAATDRGIVAFGNRSDTDAAFGVQFAAGAWSPVYLPDGQKEGIFTARRLNVTDGRIAPTGTRWAGDHIEGVVLTVAGSDRGGRGTAGEGRDRRVCRAEAGRDRRVTSPTAGNAPPPWPFSARGRHLSFGIPPRTPATA